MAAKILFSAQQDNKGPELWVTDGTGSGTYGLKDKYGNYVYAPLYMTSLGNGEMIFSASDSTHGKELWVTDGTSAGTKLLTDVNTGGTGSYPGANTHGITYLGNSTHKALFTAEDGSSYSPDLWVTDGTAGAGHTYMLRDTANSVVPTYTYDIAALGNGKALFDAQDNLGNYGDELWVTDGTNAGTHRLTDIYSGFAGSNPRDITAISSGKAVFQATDGNASGDHGTELWVSDGTAGAGHTYMLKDINTGTNSNGGTYGSSPHDFAALGNGKAVFAADSGSGDQLWVTDGTTGGTTSLLDNNSTVVAAPSYLTPLAGGTNKALFVADNGTNGAELWVTDGASGIGHTYMVADIYPGSGPSFPHDITALGNGKALFAANDGTYGSELWVTDGIAGAGHTYRLTDLNYGINSSSPLDITAIGGGKALFQANYATDFTHKYGIELFITDGTVAGTKLVKNIYPDTTATESSNPSGFAVLTPVCFCRGTLIRTDCGEVAVEELAVGDRVETVSGAFEPIRWIGFGRDLVTRRNRLARPVIVRQGALADNVPRRDLYLTHGHALYVEGVLIPVEHLINHRSILWDDDARIVEYYHIELDSHDVVLAEGAPAESYYDASNRALFQNTRAGSEAGVATSTCAPVLNGGDVVDRIWAALFARSGGQIERDTADDPDLHLVVDGERLNPVSSANGVYSFALDRPPAGRLRLCSRSGVPSLMGLSRSEHRRLGVAIKQLLLHGSGVMTSFDHDAPLLAEGGGHLPENGYCWTDGELDLPAAAFAHLRGAFTLIVHTERQSMRYPVEAAVAEAARAGAAAA